MWMNGIPVLNCIDYYDNFNIADALSDSEALINFAKYHLAFDPLNRHCIKMLDAALHDPGCEFTSETDFWKNADLTGVPPWVYNVVKEAFLSYRNKSSGNQMRPAEEWGKEFAVAAAATLLAGKHSFSLPEKNRKADTGLLDLSLNMVSITPGYTYRCKYTEPPRSGTADHVELRTVIVNVRPGYSGEAVIRFGPNETVRCESGDTLFLNVRNDSAVYVLPDEVQCNHNVLRRDHKQKCITFNGRRTNIPFGASSFACLGEGKYLYILDNRLSYIGVDINMVPVTLTGKQFKCVEVKAADDRYYVLSRNGIVKNSEGDTPQNMRSHFLRLNDALGEM